jgi:kynurenine formamidase
MNDVLTYSEWMEAVDEILIRAVGLDQMSMADWLSRDAYEGGATPLEAAQECLLEQDILSDAEIDRLLGI